MFKEHLPSQGIPKLWRFVSLQSRDITLCSSYWTWMFIFLNPKIHCITEKRRENVFLSYSCYSAFSDSDFWSILSWVLCVFEFSPCMSIGFVTLLLFFVFVFGTVFFCASTNNLSFFSIALLVLWWFQFSVQQAIVVVIFFLFFSHKLLLSAPILFSFSSRLFSISLLELTIFRENVSSFAERVIVVSFFYCVE